MTADRDQEQGCRLVAVVVTHDRLAKLRVTLARLLAASPADLDAVVVVDNASRDGTGAWLAEQEDPRLCVLTQTANLGGAGGFETGMRLASARFDPDWMVLMDDDARPAPDALAAFHALPDTGWDAVAAAVYFPDGSLCPVNRPSYNPFSGRVHVTAAEYEGPAIAVDAATFVGLFVSRAAIARVGYPDGRLFVYGDDGLFTLALSQAGGRIGFEPAIRFEHDCSTFDGHRFQPLWKVYYYHRNLLLFYRRAGGWRFWPACLLLLPKWLAKARHHPGQRRAFLRLMQRALRDGLAARLEVSHAEIRALAEPQP